MVFRKTIHFTSALAGLIFSIKRLVERTVSSEGGIPKKEIVMSAHGHTTVWGTHLGIGRPTDARRWYQQLKAWWADHQAARRRAYLARLDSRWDARREAVRFQHADAAVDMVVPAHACSITTALCDLGS
jgi:hypothetical protein